MAEPPAERAAPPEDANLPGPSGQAQCRQLRVLLEGSGVVVGVSWGGGSGASGKRCNDQDASASPGAPLSACCAIERVVPGIRVAQGSGTGWLGNLGLPSGSGTGWLGNFAPRLVACVLSLGNLALRLVACVLSLGNLAPRLLPRGCFLGNFKPRLRGVLFPSRSEVPQFSPDRLGWGPSFPSGGVRPGSRREGARSSR